MFLLCWTREADLLVDGGVSFTVLGVHLHITDALSMWTVADLVGGLCVLIRNSPDAKKIP